MEGKKTDLGLEASHGGNGRKSSALTRDLEGGFMQLLKKGRSGEDAEKCPPHREAQAERLGWVGERRKSPETATLSRKDLQSLACPFPQPPKRPLGGWEGRRVTRPTRSFGEEGGDPGLARPAAPLRAE